MSEPTSVPIFTPQDSKDPQQFKLNTAMKQIYSKLGSLWGATGGTVNLYSDLAMNSLSLNTGSAIPTDDSQVLTLGAANKLYAPSAQRQALLSGAYLGGSSQPLPGGGGGAPAATPGPVIEAADYCGGGGLTNTCINNAIAYLASISPSGGSIHVKSGTWSFNGPVNCNLANVTIYGDGNGTICSRTANMPSGQGMFDITVSGITLESMQINGQVTSPTGLLYNTAPPNGFYVASPETGSNVNYPLASTLTGNTSIWVHGGSNNFIAYSLMITQSGGYAILVDASSTNILNAQVLSCVFTENKPHLFGTSSLDINYGSWTGGVFYCGGTYQGGSGTLSYVNGLTVNSCWFQENNGNCVWGYSPQTTVLNNKIVITGNHFQDCGLDGTNPGASQNVTVGDNVYYRIGYINGNPKYLSGANAVAMDTSGFVRSVKYVGNTVFNVNGFGASLDGFTDGAFSGNNISNAAPGDYYYTVDQVASYNAGTQGVQTNNTYDIRGGQNVSITGNTIKNMGDVSIALWSNRSSIVSGNTIYHPATAASVPIELGNNVLSGTVNRTGTAVTWVSGNKFDTNIDGTYTSGLFLTSGYIYIVINGVQYQIASVTSSTALTLVSASGSDTGAAYVIGELQNNTVTSNQIYYNALNVCIYEDTNVYGPNYIYDNRVIGTNRGEVGIGIATGNQSRTNYVIGTNQPYDTGSPNPQSQNIMQREGVGTSATFKVYSNVSGTGTLLLSLADLGILNVSQNGASGTGAVVTAGRSTFGSYNDYVYTGQTIMDNMSVWGMYNNNTSGNDTLANSLNDSYGLIRYERPGGVGTGGIFQISVGTSAGSRVWTTIGTSGSVAGSDTWVQYNKSLAFGADGNFTWAYSTQLLTITGTSDSGAAIATGLGYIQSYSGFYVADAGAGTASRSYQAVHIAAGGVWARSLVAQKYIFVGHSTGVPTGTTGDTFPANGDVYYDDGTNTFQGYQGGAWVSFATGGSTSPGGSTNSVQVNNGGSFGAAGGSNTFSYNLTTGVLAVGAGYVQSQGGFVSLANSWQALNMAGSGGGSYVAGEIIKPYGSTGAYLDLNPLGYGSYPVPLAGLASFGATDALLWVSTANGTSSPLTSVGLQTNTFINAAAGFVTGATAANAIQAPSGGVLAQTLALNVASPSGTNYPTATFYASSGTRGRIFGPVSASANLFISENISYSGSAWNVDSTAGSYSMVQLASVASGVTFTIYAGTTASNPVSLNAALNINTLGNAAILTTPSTTAGIALTIGGTSGQPGLVVAGGYAQSDQGFYSPSSAVTAINIPSGGAQFGKGVQVDSAYYMKGLASAPANPGAGYGGTYWTGTGAVYGIWNGSSYLSFNFASSAAVSSVTGSGSGISVSPTTGAVIVQNTGVTSLTPGSGISLTAGTGAVTVTNAGVVSLTGTTNQVNVSASSGAVTLSLPQNINTAANVNFGALALSNTSSTSLQVGLSLGVSTGGIQCGAIASTSTAYNAIATQGGFSSGTGSLGGFYVGGTQVVNNLAQFVGNGVNVGSQGVACGAVAIGTGGYVYFPSLGYVGQTLTVYFPGGFQIGGSPYHYLGFYGGVWVNYV